MKMCSKCHEKPVSSPRSKYCDDCRKIALSEAHSKPKADSEPEETCSGCHYYRHFSGGMNACHYTIDTGRVRGMSPEECYRHDGTPYMPKR